MDIFAQDDIYLCENLKCRYFKIVYITDGEGICTIGTVAHKIVKGNYMIFDLDDTYDVSGDVKTTCIMFRPELLNKKYRDITETENLFKVIIVGTGYNIIREKAENKIFFGEYIGERVSFIIEELDKKSFGYEGCVKGAVLEIVLRSARSISVEEKSTNIEAVINRIIFYADKYYNEDIKLSQLAEEFEYSASYISECFKEFTGYTFSQYLKTVRMRAAHQMIQDNPEMSVEKIAAFVGYSDIKYFSSVFKTTIGITPGKDMQEMKKIKY